MHLSLLFFYYSTLTPPLFNIFVPYPFTQKPYSFIISYHCFLFLFKRTWVIIFEISTLYIMCAMVGLWCKVLFSLFDEVCHEMQNCWHTPSSLMDSIMNPKVKTTKREKVGACSLVNNISGVKGACWSPKMGTKKIGKQVNYSHEPAQIKQQVG